MGIFPRPGGHVISQVLTEKSWVPRGGAELPARHRSPDAGYKYAEKGLFLLAKNIPKLLNPGTSRDDG